MMLPQSTSPISFRLVKGLFMMSSTSFAIKDEGGGKGFLLSRARPAAEVSNAMVS